MLALWSNMPGCGPILRSFRAGRPALVVQYRSHGAATQGLPAEDPVVVQCSPGLPAGASGRQAGRNVEPITMRMNAAGPSAYGERDAGNGVHEEFYGNALRGHGRQVVQSLQLFLDSHWLQATRSNIGDWTLCRSASWSGPGERADRHCTQCNSCFPSLILHLFAHDA